MTAAVGSADEFQVAFDGVSLRRGDRSVFDGLSCGFLAGRITVVLGGSGSGKSTLLRLVGGLQRPDRGAVRVAGEDVTRLSEPELFNVRDRIGMLFQGGALLDSLSIFDNLALALREHSDLGQEEIAAEVARRLDAVGLPGTAELYPRELSGGMQRRAALARAIITRPDVVLCDEPFSGLDPVNVRRIEAVLVGLNARDGLTVAITSHHLPSALRMAHRIVFLHEGRAIAGTPQEIRNSTHPAVSAFLQAELDDAMPASLAALQGPQ